MREIMIIMTIEERVQKILKPKVKQFGFNKKAFRRVAANIADKLGDINDDASEDDINSRIDETIGEMMPYLALVQSLTSEQVEEWKKSQQKGGNDEEEEDDDSDNDSSRKNRPTRSNRAKAANNGAATQSPELKELMEAVKALTTEVSSLKAGKTADTRRNKLEAMLKDAGVFGKRILRDFSKMNFKDEDEYEEYLSEIGEDLEANNQERANAGLSKAGSPPGGKGNKPESKEAAFSDDEIDAMAE